MTKEVMTANKAVAEAVRLAKPQVIPVYPINLKQQFQNTLHNMLQMKKLMQNM